MSRTLPLPADSGALTLEGLREVVRMLGPVPPRRWMVRAAGLEPAEDAALDLLAIDSRPERSAWLPLGALAVVFEGAGFGAGSMDWRVDRALSETAKMTVIYRDGFDGARVNLREEGSECT